MHWSPFCADVKAHEAQLDDVFESAGYLRLRRVLSALRTELTRDPLLRERSALTIPGNGKPSGHA